jgi:hypothetical protein
MSSNINPNNIDTTYPIAGQDNDSQGFRDNFTNIKTNFQYAEDELSDLQSKVVLKSALTGTTLDNDMGGAPIKNPTLQGVRYTPVLLDSQTGSVVIDFSAGQYFSVATGDSISLDFANLPSAGNYAIWQVAVTITNIAYTLTLPSAVGSGASATSLANILGRSGQIITFESTGTYVFQFSTVNGGSAIFIEDLTRNAEASLAINELTDVVITSPVNNQLLKYNSASNTWVNSTVTYTLDNLSDVVVSTPVNNQLLKYNSVSNTWVNSTVTYSLDNLSDVVITSPTSNDILVYNSISNLWTNQSQSDSVYPTIVVNVTIADNGSGTQEVFFFDGTALKTNTGVVDNFTFSQGVRYRFDVSDYSNTNAPLRFSTTPDTAVPASITPYTTDVTVSGTAGSPGAYVDILITPDTPSPLYFYAEENDPMIDTSLIGAALPIPVYHPGTFYTGTEDLASTAAASLQVSNSDFSTAAAETATLAAGTNGQIKVFTMHADGGDMVITVANAGWKTSGTGTITFDTVGDSCMLQYINSKWMCIGNNGAVFA